MAFTRVQGAQSTESSSAFTTKTVTLSAVGSGNAVLGLVSWDLAGGITLSSVTDDKGNTYNLETSIDDTTNSGRTACFSRTNITNAPTVITATFSSSIGFVGIIADEFSGTSTASSDERDGAAHGGQFQLSPGTGTDACTSGNFTTSVNGDLIWGATANTGGNVTPTTGTGFTTGTQSTWTDYRAASEYRTQTTAGAGTAATFTQASFGGGHETFLIAIKPASGGSSSTAAAAGTGAVAAVGASTASATASAAGTGAVAAVGQSTASSTGSASGTGAVAAQAMGQVAAAGIGAVAAVGASKVSSTAAAAGTGAVAAQAMGQAAAAGTGAVAAIGQSTASATASAAGTGAVAAIAAGSSIAAASGTGTVSGVGQSTAEATGAAAGTGAVAATGNGSSNSVGSAAGTGAVAAVGASTASATGSATGTGAVAAVGASTAESTASGAGTGTVNGVGTTVTYIANAAGVGAVNGVGVAIGTLIVDTGSGGGSPRRMSDWDGKRTKRERLAEAQLERAQEARKVDFRKAIVDVVRPPAPAPLPIIIEKPTKKKTAVTPAPDARPLEIAKLQETAAKARVIAAEIAAKGNTAEIKQKTRVAAEKARIVAIETERRRKQREYDDALAIVLLTSP